MWGRESKESGRVQTKIRGFKPYMYIPASTEEPHILDIFDRPVKKLEVRHPSDVPKLRGDYDFTCEADILFNLRYLIDKGITCGYKVDDDGVSPAEDPGVPPLVLYFDLEVLSPPEIMPESADAAYPICAISAANSYDNTLDVFLWGMGSDVANRWTRTHRFEWTHKEQELHKDMDVVIHMFESELAMLDAFIKHIARLDPDVLTAWNGNWFDYPYLYNRCKQFRLPIRRVSPMRKIMLRLAGGQSSSGYVNKMQEFWIKGRDATDMLQVYRAWRSNLGQLPSYDFKYVTKLETGYDYVDYGAKMVELLGGPTMEEIDPRKGDWDTFVMYCMNDAFAMKLMDETIDLVDSYDRKRRIAGTMISDAMSNKKIIDTWLLRMSKKPLPTSRLNTAEGFRGAVVLNAIPGIHDLVAIYDLKAIYPNLIAGFNLSPETIDPKGDIAVPIDGKGITITYRREPEGLMARAVMTFLNKREEYREYKKIVIAVEDAVKEDWYTIDEIIERSGFTYDEVWEILQGLISEEWVEEKDLLYHSTRKGHSQFHTRVDKNEKDYKWLSASAYGVFGYVRFRLFDERVTKTITALGRRFVLAVAKRAEELGYLVTYGDTDSIFIQLNHDTPEERQWLEDELNKTMAKIATSMNAIRPPIIKYEQTFIRVLMKMKIGSKVAAKKRYAGARSDGTLYIRGLEPRRSDTSQVTRDSITKWLEMVLVDDNLSGANAYLRSIHDDIPNMPLNQVGIPKGIKKATNNPWVRGRDWSAKSFGYRFRPDRKPILLYVKRVRGNLDPTKEMCITEDITEIPAGVTIDWKKQREKILKRKFEDLLVSAGSSWEEAVEGRKQTSLFSFSG